LDGQTILVTGSCGSIGSEIARQLLKFRPAKLVLMDRSETGQFFLERELSEEVDAGRVEVILGDATDEKRVQQILKEHDPLIIFHAAAYKHVPLMEAHPQEAVKNIVQATRILADAAHEHGCESFVMISTDKAVNPTNVMGCCKRVAELYVQAMSRHSDTRFVTVRFGNVLGSNGSVIPIFREQIAAGGPLTVTHPDMTRYFMTIPEASQLVIQAGRMGEGGEIFVLDMGQPVKIVELAKDMIKLSGLSEEDIDVEFTGLRPGEKMYEELYTDDEQRQRTTHPKILVAESVSINRAEISKQIRRLIAISLIDEDLIRGELKQIVPLYSPESSNATISITPSRAA
ncbi:MAG: UDP-N-acetylglucosamine 4,6-dehydratase family protein, partial [Candidatus Paceibacterota bacterium]